MYGDVFTLAERDFFKHRLITQFPKISEEGIETLINFLEQQKLANCPCSVHSEQRCFGWIVFRRQPDRIICDCKDIPEMEDDPTDDEDFFSVEADDPIVTPAFGDEFDILADDPQYNICSLNKNQDPSGSDSSVSETPSSTDFLMVPKQRRPTRVYITA